MTGFPLDLVEIEKIDPLHEVSIISKGNCYKKRNAQSMN